MIKNFFGAVGLLTVLTIAISRDETINALWLLTGAICIYAIAYRFYSA